MPLFDFRGGNAPASLKLLNAVHPADPTEGVIFPGWKRPGLIEASALADTTTTRLRFPGWKRPGLIEAQASSVLQVAMKAHFRGGNAPASLKPDQYQMGSTCQNFAESYFRGGNAPASLKLGAHGGADSRPSPSVRQFPGWKRPGLIEAKAAMSIASKITSRPRISGVETPRPH